MRQNSWVYTDTKKQMYQKIWREEKILPYSIMATNKPRMCDEAGKLLMNRVSRWKFDLREDIYIVSKYSPQLLITKRKTTTWERKHLKNRYFTLTEESKYQYWKTWTLCESWNDTLKRTPHAFTDTPAKMHCLNLSWANIRQLVQVRGDRRDMSCWCNIWCWTGSWTRKNSYKNMTMPIKSIWIWYKDNDFISVLNYLASITVFT